MLTILSMSAIVKTRKWTRIKMPFTILRTLREFLLFSPHVPCLVQNPIENPLLPLVVMPPSSLPIWDSSSLQSCCLISGLFQALKQCWAIILSNTLQFGSLWHLFSNDWKEVIHLGPECHRSTPRGIISGGTQVSFYSLPLLSSVFLFKQIPFF